MSRYRMFLPVAMLLLLFAGYSGYWFLTADQVKKGIIVWAQEEEARGATARYDSLEVSGFPYRIIVRATNPVLGDAEGTWRFESEVLEGYAQPFNLNHVIAQIGGPFTFERTRRLSGMTQRDRFEGEAESAQASFVFERGGLQRLAVSLKGAEADHAVTARDAGGGLIFSQNETMSAELLEIHTRRRPDAQAPEPEGAETPGMRHQFALTTENMVWSGHPYKALGDTITRLNVRLWLNRAPDDGGLHLDEAFLAQWRDNGGTADIDAFDLVWGPLNLSVDGEVGLDPSNRLDGQVSLSLKGYDPLIEALVQAGSIPSERAEQVQKTLDMMAKRSAAGEKTATAPLTLDKGKVKLGPLTLGELPPVR